MLASPKHSNVAQCFLTLVTSCGLAFFGLSSFALPAYASSSLGVAATATVVVGGTVTVSIRVSTNGQSANSFQGTLSYPADLLDGVRGSYSGSICTLPIQQPDPSGGTASFSCGTPGGFTGNGTVATVVFTAKASGTASFHLSDCQVLANDGMGTDITGGCGSDQTIITATASSPTPKPATPKPSSTPRPTPTPRPNGPSQPVETPRTAPSTPTPAPPPVVTLAPSTPTPSTAAVVSLEPTTTPSSNQSLPGAFRSIFRSFKDINTLPKDTAGAVALGLTVLPIAAAAFGSILLLYRLFLLDRRRRRTLDRLFELELSELASLEGKMDLLGEKGVKGREEYREEFKKAKEKILRQIRPDYGKPVDNSTTPPAEPPR